MLKNGSIAPRDKQAEDYFILAGGLGMLTSYKLAIDILLERTRTEDALALYDKIAEFDKQGYRDKAKTLERLGKPEEALVEYEKSGPLLSASELADLKKDPGILEEANKMFKEWVRTLDSIAFNEDADG